MAESHTTNGSGMSQFTEQAQARLGQLREEFADADRRARAVVQEYPIATVLGAALLGYLLARLARRG